MKSRLLLVFLVLTAIIPLLSCSGNENDDFTLSGDYTYGKCVYLSPFSSATIEYRTETNEGLVHLNFVEGSVSIYRENEVILNGENPSFTKEVLAKDIDDSINFDMDPFLDSVSDRYDLYCDDEYSGYTIFSNQTNLYLAKIQTLGEEKDLVVWEIFEIHK